VKVKDSAASEMPASPSEQSSGSSVGMRPGCAALKTELVTVHVGSLKMTDMMLQDVKLTDHIAGRKIVRREIAGHEIARLYIAGREIAGHEIDGNEIVGHENAGHEIARHCFVRSISRAT